MKDALEVVRDIYLDYRVPQKNGLPFTSKHFESVTVLCRTRMVERLEDAVLNSIADAREGGLFV